MVSAHDIYEMLPSGVHAEVIEGEVIVNAATPAGRHALIIQFVRDAFASRGIKNLYENTTLLVEPDEDAYVPDLARWPVEVLRTEAWEFPASECLFALEVVSGDRVGKRQRDYRKAAGYARGGVPVLLIVDSAQRVCTLYTEPKGSEYLVRRVTAFGEPVIIPAGAFPVTLATDKF
ncbi:MAG: Uma2 family endonuclease [Streptosporangiales bacterium]|nr:Uma2 family endonuclease [Streptosporangiales bacterium]